ncbi:MAG: Hsp20/alpha crystallin family protein [Clostridiales bacterium]|nr:Hsp20/alpha crystallin family protein [Clostridiales bacterium]
MSSIIPSGGSRRPWWRRRETFPFWPSFLEDWLDDDFFFLPQRLRSFRADVRETEDQYVVEADLPGVPKEAIRVSYEGGVLSIAVEEQKDVEQEEGEYLRRERYRGRTERHFVLENVREDEIQASFKDGVLKVVLPKMKKSLPRGRDIPIQ